MERIRKTPKRDALGLDIDLPSKKAVSKPKRPPSEPRRIEADPAVQKLIDYLEKTFRYQLTTGDIEVFGNDPSPQHCFVKEHSRWMDVNLCRRTKDYEGWLSVLKNRNVEKVITFLEKARETFPETFGIPQIHPAEKIFQKTFSDQTDMAHSLQNWVQLSDIPEILPFIRRYSDLLGEPISATHAPLYIDQYKKSETTPGYWEHLERTGKLRKLLSKIFPQNDLLDLRIRIKEIAESETDRTDRFINFLEGFYSRFGPNEPLDHHEREYVFSYFEDEDIFWLYLLAQEKGALDFMEEHHRLHPKLSLHQDPCSYYLAFQYQKNVGSLAELEETYNVFAGSTIYFGWPSSNRIDDTEHIRHLQYNGLIFPYFGSGGNRQNINYQDIYPIHPLFTEKEFTHFYRTFMRHFTVSDLRYLREVGLNTFKTYWNRDKSLEKEIIQQRSVPFSTSFRPGSNGSDEDPEKMEFLYRLFQKIPSEEWPSTFQKLKNILVGLQSAKELDSRDVQWEPLIAVIWDSHSDTFSLTAWLKERENIDYAQVVKVMETQYGISFVEVKKDRWGENNFIFHIERPYQLLSLSPLQIGQMSEPRYIEAFQKLKRGVPKADSFGLFIEIVTKENPESFFIRHPVMPEIDSRVADKLDQFSAVAQEAMQKVYHAYGADPTQISVMDQYLLLQKAEAYAQHLLKPEVIALYETLKPHLDIQESSDLFDMNFGQDVFAQKEKYYPFSHLLTLHANPEVQKWLEDFLNQANRHMPDLKLPHRDMISMATAYHGMTDRGEETQFWTWFDAAKPYLEKIAPHFSAGVFFSLLTLTEEERENFLRLAQLLDTIPDYKWQLFNQKDSLNNYFKPKTAEEEMHIGALMAMDGGKVRIDFHLALSRLEGITTSLKQLMDYGFVPHSLASFGFQFSIATRPPSASGRVEIFPILETPVLNGDIQKIFRNNEAFQFTLKRLEQRYGLSRENLFNHFDRFSNSLEAFSRIMPDLMIMEYSKVKPDFKKLLDKPEDIYESTVYAGKIFRHPLVAKTDYSYRVSDHAFLQKDFENYLKDPTLKTLLAGGRESLKAWLTEKLRHLEPEARHFKSLPEQGEAEKNSLGALSRCSEADLIKLFAMVRALEDPLWRNEVGSLLDRDFFDILDSEVGGNITFKRRVLVSPIEPTQKTGDGTYTQSDILLHRRAEMGDFHNHSVQLGKDMPGTEFYAAPSHPDFQVSNSHLLDSILFTRLPNGRFNIDFYSYDGTAQGALILLDLGNWSYEGRSVSIPSNTAIR
ncbi:MAG: hypothetical protein Q7T03_02145 [Deltaproteobacteria bacterium]|nr:hypothetical protein [Deltaproteobacteria bacterium]